MKRLLIILVLLPSVAFGQSAFVNCVDSIYAMYSANLSHPPNPTQAAQMVAMASKTCRCMSSYIGDTTSGGGGLTWSDTLTYIATRYYVLTHGGSTDSTVYSTKAWRQKGIDSINANYYLASNPSAFISQVNNVYGTLITSYNDIAVDTSKVASHYFVTSSIHDSLPNLSGYFPTADTTYLFRKADSNTKGHAATFNLVADTAAVLRGLIPTGTMVNSVTATAPITLSAATGTVNIGMPQATGSVNGYLGSSDWTKFDKNTVGAFFTSIPYSILNTSMSVTLIATTTQTITGWYICGDQSGSITIGLTDNGSDMISTGNHPLLSSAQTNNASVSGWTSTTITAGHVYKFTLSGITSLQSCSILLTTTL